MKDLVQHVSKMFHYAVYMYIFLGSLRFHQHKHVSPNASLPLFLLFSDKTDVTKTTQGKYLNSTDKHISPGARNMMRVIFFSLTILHV